MLKGFESRGEVPINFPQDICMFQLKQQTFAVALSFGKNRTTNDVLITAPTMSIFIRKDGKFTKIYSHPASKFLTKIDCSATKEAGYVAFVNTIREFDLKPEQLSKQGSQVLRITLSASGEPQVEDFQKFARLNQNNVRLWSRESSIYLMFSYNTDASSDLNICTVYKLGETFFDRIDKLPCQNARVIEFFTVHHDLMLLIGNYQGNNGTTNTFSTIMRYDLNQKAFVEHQKISTEAIAVGKYFYLDHRDQRQHFLFVGNSFEVGEFGLINYEVPSMIYKLVNGFFIPMQTINVKHIQAMLPIAVSFCLCTGTV